ncbi:MAG: ABC transporter permease subunit [Alphaproteobacteria bacterium]|nr:ABC transporter permease subunit [Alphaproteobacteria bacterium]
MHTLLVARRDLAAYLHGYAGWVIVAAVLFVTGLLFQTRGLGAGPQLSHEVLETFFENCGGLVMIAGILFTMRSLAEERQLGTDVLLQTSPATDAQVVVGKWLAAMGMMALTLALTLYMPALIFVNGKVSLAHIAVGYTGLLSLAAATTAIGIAASSLFRTQLPAGILGAVVLVTLLLGWLLSDVTDAPFKDVLAYAAFWDKHFTTFMEGRLHVRDLAYYASVTFAFLLAATKVLEGRRWQ